MYVLYVAVLLPCRHAILNRIHTPLVCATRFLTKDYKEELFAWELVELARRTILVGWILRIPPEHTFLRLLVAVFLSVASVIALLSARPYRRAEDNLLAAGCNAALVFIFMGASLIRLFSEFSTVCGESVAQRVMAFNSTDAIAAPLVFSFLLRLLFMTM